jgi:dihydroorotase
MDRITLTRPDDWHLHLRDGEALKSVLADTARRFARAIIMPNLNPPVTTVAAAAGYRDRIVSALPSGSDFEPLMTLYLTDNTKPAEIHNARASGIVNAVKYYPAGATTNSDCGVTDIRKCIDTLETMAETGMPLLIHGEVTDAQVDVFRRGVTAGDQQERDQRVEERRGRRPAGDGDADGHEQVAGLPATRLRESTERRFELFRFE